MPISASHTHERTLSLALRVLLPITAIVAIRFVVEYALPYLALNPTQFGAALWPRR